MTRKKPSLSKALVVLGIAAIAATTFRLLSPLSRVAELWLAGLLVLSIVLWLVPKMQRPVSVDALEAFKAENEARKTLAEIVGGCVLIIGAYHAWLQIEATREGLKISQQGQRDTARLAEQGQITDRFTHAVEQLGNPRLEVRLGGIYALEQIARTSDKNHLAIIELLTTCVRESVPWPPSDRPASESAKQVNAVQAMLTVVGRRDVQGEQPKMGTGKPHWWNLRRTDLRGRALPEAQLAWFDLTDAHLTKADLARAHLEHSDLSEADLEGASLGGAGLILANLHGANLQCADLSGADLRKVRAKGADFRGAQFVETTQLDQASLEEADLRQASLVGIESWERVESLKLANVFGIRDARPGFRDRALRAGAVEARSDAEWLALIKAKGGQGRRIRHQTWPCPARD
jgi:uncharacterized protein YjbI with pentapeptide repeats